VALPLQGPLQVQMSVTKARKQLTKSMSFQLALESWQRLSGDNVVRLSSRLVRQWPGRLGSRRRSVIYWTKPFLKQAHILLY